MFFSAVNFFKFLVIKTLDHIWIRNGIQPKMLDPYPESMNTDPKHCPGSGSALKLIGIHNTDCKYYIC